MSRPRRPSQKQGHKQPSAAQIAAETSSTYGDSSATYSNSTNAWQRRSDDFESVPVANVVKDFEDTPITFGHIQLGWKVFLIVCSFVVFVGGIVWWASAESSQIAQHDDDIKEIKVSTEKLINESAVTTVRLQDLNVKVDKLENKTLVQEQLKERKRR